MTDFIILVSIVVTFSLVQSVLGVGLLLIGTPTLVLMGHPFENALITLLPSSMAISLLQLHRNLHLIREFNRSLWLIILPATFCGIVFVLLQKQQLNIKLIIGTILLSIGMVRLHPFFTKYLVLFIKKYEIIYLIILGLIHGISSMGGGFLTIYVNSTSEDKNAIRTRIAYGYFFMALIQLTTLMILKNPPLEWTHALFPMVAASTYFLAGNYFFRNTSLAQYQRLVTALITSYGIIVCYLSLAER